MKTKKGEIYSEYKNQKDMIEKVQSCNLKYSFGTTINFYSIAVSEMTPTKNRVDCIYDTDTTKPYYKVEIFKDGISGIARGNSKLLAFKNSRKEYESKLEDRKRQREIELSLRPKLTIEEMIEIITVKKDRTR